jgi:hypothetical protein
MDDVTTLMAKALGQKGGRKTVEKYGKEHMKRISDLATQARKAKAEAKKKSSY